MLLSVKDLTQYLGIKQSTLYSWASSNKIPCIKIYGLLRFEKDKIDAWIKSFEESKSVRSCLNPIRRRKKQADIDLILDSAKQEACNGKPGRHHGLRKEA